MHAAGVSISQHFIQFYMQFSDEDEVAQLLVAENADVNSKNNKGATALIIAAVKGHHSVLRILANHPAVNLHEPVCADEQLCYSRCTY